MIMPPTGYIGQRGRWLKIVRLDAALFCDILHLPGPGQSASSNLHGAMRRCRQVSQQHTPRVVVSQDNI